MLTTSSTSATSAASATLPTSSTSATSSINSKLFYKTYHGHSPIFLVDLVRHIRKNYPGKGIIWLAGDSSLDNKFWLDDNFVPALNGYETILSPPVCKQDVAYCINKNILSLKKPKNYVAVNCSIEESTLADRSDNKLKDQDRIIRNYIDTNDILVISVGGNDIALKPTIGTIWNMLLLTSMNSMETLKGDPDNIWGFSYFRKMFSNKLKDYILNMIGSKRPKKILVSVIYFPDMKVGEGWADTALGYLGYNKDPAPLQEVIKQLYNNALSMIQIDGTTIVPIPLFKVMDGTDTNDYVQRVEPSAQGGDKMAKLFLRYI